MSVFEFSLTILAGGLGAATRLIADGSIRAHIGGVAPWATIIINVTGSLALGLLAGLVAAPTLPESWQAILGSGFLGGYTTFSTASVETVCLAQEGTRTPSVLTGLGTIIGATLAAAWGMWIGTLV